ncbi:MAG: hypothetical protein ABS36_12385 [Acidobacteria bacterium SCN 69-37]|nr:MAG: hypothetical protein ABS36_12385 [Acidobacteria bacterium SCN 69-37]
MKVNRDAWGLVVATFVSAVALNFGWEMAQARLYEPMGTAWEATRRCFVASLGDGLMILLVVAGGAMLFRTGRWFVEPAPARFAFAAVAGLIVAVAVELWGLATGRWTYQVYMPRVPGTELGAVPLVQMVILTPLSLWLAAAWRSR